MTLRERIENNLTLFILGMLLAGFVAGVTVYRAILEIVKPEVVSRGTSGSSQSSPGAERSARVKQEPESQPQAMDRIRELEALVGQERTRAERAEKALQTMQTQTTERVRELEELARQERTRAENAEKALQATRGEIEQLKKAGGASPAPYAPPLGIASQSKRVADLTIGVKRLLVAKGRIIVALDFLSHSDETILLGVRQSPAPSLVDDRGNVFKYGQRGAKNWVTDVFVITDDFLTLNAKAGNDVLMEFFAADRDVRTAEIGTNFVLSFSYLTYTRRDKISASHTVTFNDLRAQSPR